MTTETDISQLRDQFRLFALQVDGQIRALQSLAIKNVLNRASHEDEPLAWVQAFVGTAAREIDSLSPAETEDGKIMNEALAVFYHDTLETILMKAQG